MSSQQDTKQFYEGLTSGQTKELKGGITNLFLDNLERYRAGQPLQNVVNKQAGYYSSRSIG